MCGVVVERRARSQEGWAGRIGALFVAACAVGGCNEDVVQPGFYGPAPAETPAAGGAVAGSTGGVGAVGGADGPGVAGVGGVGGMSAPVGGVEAGTSGDVAPPTVDDLTPPVAGDEPCDMRGRWLVTMHVVTDAIGQQQTIHSWAYYEIDRQGDAYTVSKGLVCGDDGAANGLFAVTADFRASWDTVMEKVKLAGRAVTGVPVGGGCDVRFAKWYTVKGATVPYYTDPSISLPGPDQPASGSTPGWEDWDGDGNPGISGILSGAVTGKVFTAPRQWTEFAGTVTDLDSTIRLSVNWNQEVNLLGYDGSPLLASEAVRAADPNLHFVELVRLRDGEAVGSDYAICDQILELAPQLTPNAHAI